MTFESNYEARIVSNREVRRIPRGWQHPRDARGRYIPHLARSYWQELIDEAGTTISPPMPTIEDASGVEIAAYETTTEGTPISPAFPDTPEGKLALVNYCAEHAFVWGDSKADAETWAGILFGGDLATIGLDGSVRFS